MSHRDIMDAPTSDTFEELETRLRGNKSDLKENFKYLKFIWNFEKLLGGIGNTIKDTRSTLLKILRLH